MDKQYRKSPTPGGSGFSEEKIMANQQQLQAIHDLTGGDVYDAEWDGGTWMMEAVETAETIEQFIESSSKWAERGKMRRGTFAGLPVVTWERVQPAKGQPRRDVAVIDFGTERIVIDHTLREWIE